MARASWRILILVALSLAARGPAGVGAQQGQTAQPPLKFRAGVDLITLDISVLDRARQPVRGLNAADFLVTEDGLPVEIQTFSAVDLPDTVVTASAPWVSEVAPDVRRNDDLNDRRILTIVMDDALEAKIEPQRPAAIQDARRIAGVLVDSLGPRDLAAVVFPMSQDNGQDFTTDRARLHRAIEKYHGGLPARLGLADPASVPGMLQEAPGSIAFRRRFAYEQLTNLLKTLADNLGELPNRRKALVLVSEGIPMNVEEIQVRQSLSDGDDTAGTLRNVYLTIRDLIVSAQRANVNIYPIDPAGLWPGANSYKQDFLRALATNTGGFPVVDTNDPRPEIDQIFKENSSYYLIGYVSPNTRQEGRFHKVEVKVRDRSLTVRTRTGYLEPLAASPSKKTPPKPLPLMTALASLVPKGDVAMQMAAAPFAVPGSKKAAVAIVVGLREPVPPGSDRVVENVTLRVDAYDPKGDQKGSQRLSARIALRPSLSPTAGYELLARLDLPPGRYQLRAAAQSSLQSKAGSIFYDLDVPDFAKPRLSLSGVTVSVTEGPMAAPKDGLATLLPHTPTTARDFERDRQVTAFLRVYRPGGAAAGAVNVAVSILDGAGAPVFSRRDVLEGSRFTADGAADYPIELPLDRLKPGEHLLTVSASAGGATASRELRFTVR